MSVRPGPVEVVDEPVPELVSLLESLLTEARAGRIRAVVGVYECGDGGSGHFRSISSPKTCVVRLLGQVGLLRARLVQFIEE